jgi:PPM family protein phosphatase
MNLDDTLPGSPQQESLGGPGVACHGKSDAGLKRPSNEDAFFINNARRLYVLADGMGGAAAGEVASTLFIEAVRDVFAVAAVESEETSLRLLQKAFEQANGRIQAHADHHPERHGMGCTAEVLILFDHRFSLAHVGDSRTYIFRDGVLKQLTRDHSLVQEQLDQGVITPVEARNHPLRHVISRAVGTHENLAVDFVHGGIAAGDLFLLCSDGLTDMVDDEMISRLLSQPLSVSEQVQCLIDEAKSAGGRDNITVVLSRVVSL